MNHVARVNFEIDPDVHREAKLLAVAEGISLRDYISRAIAESNDRRRTTLTGKGHR